MLADEVLELLSQEISKNEIENYISQIKFNEKSSNSENVIFTAPNELVAKFIQTRYASKIANIFEVKTGIKPVISITTQKNRVSIKAKDIDVKQIRTQSSLLNLQQYFHL